MCIESEYCPLGLIGNCIPEKHYFSDKISCASYYYCLMQTRPWTLPFTYVEIDGIMALTVTKSYIHTEIGLSIYFQEALNYAVLECGWAVAEAIPSKNCDRFDSVPW
jgi:hypothetical protein